jgi:hypothetical protein
LSTSYISSSVFEEGADDEPSINGFGAFIFPERVTVSDRSPKLGDLKGPDPILSYKNQEPLYERRSPAGKGISVSTTDVSRTREVVVEHKFPSGKEVIVSDDGFVGVFMPKDEAVSFLNIIFATAFTWGIRGELLQESDVCEFEWNTNSKLIRITSYDIMSERNRDALMRDDPTSNQYVLWSQPDRLQLKIDHCKTILNRSEDYWTNPELHNDLILIFEGFTLILRGSFRAAFLYGWMIIEIFLGKLWDLYVNSQKGNNPSKGKTLKNSNKLDSKDIICGFATNGTISGTVSNLFHEMRKKRNKIIHARDSVNVDEAYGCVRVATLIILNRLRNPQSPFLEIEKTKLVSLWNC